MNGEKFLIVGGYGGVGRKIAAQVSDEYPGLVVVSGRNSKGFGILLEIEVQATPRIKFEAEFRPYVILGACNPMLAYRALIKEIEVGLLLPCNVIVSELNDDTVITLVDPTAMLRTVDNSELDLIATEAKQRFKRVPEKLKNAKPIGAPN